jgi:hypothetical protein
MVKACQIDPVWLKPYDMCAGPELQQVFRGMQGQVIILARFRPKEMISTESFHSFTVSSYPVRKGSPTCKLKYKKEDNSQNLFHG